MVGPGGLDLSSSAHKISGGACVPECNISSIYLSNSGLIIQCWCLYFRCYCWRHTGTIDRGFAHGNITALCNDGDSHLETMILYRTTCISYATGRILPLELATNLGRVWSSRVFQTLIITKREFQLATGIIASCHNPTFSTSKKCVWLPQKLI